MYIPFLRARSSRAETREAADNIAPSVIDSTIHNLINHLRVIGLCCCDCATPWPKSSKQINYKNFTRSISPFRQLQKQSKN
jgi:hypothetical protein